MSKINLLNNQGDEVTIEHSNTTSAQGNSVVNIKDVTKQVDTIADLKALDGSHKLVYVTGYHTAGDGAFGSHVFEWDATSTEADNGGTIIKLNSVATGRYKLKYDGAVNVKWFGAKDTNINGNENFDSTVFIQAALNSSYNVYIGIGVYLITSDITINDNTTLYGALLSTGFTNDGTVVGGNSITESSKLLLDNCSLLMGDSTQMYNVTLHNKNTPAPQANTNNFAGKAVIANGGRININKCIFLGFEYGFYSVSFSGHTISNLLIDCLNGIYIKDCYDTSRVDNVHLIPSLTLVPSIRDNDTATLSNSRMRQGVAFHSDGVGDWNKFTNCISYCWEFGFRIKDSSNVTLLNCGADNLNQGGVIVPGTFGIYVEGGANQTLLDSITIAGKDIGIKISIPQAWSINVSNSVIKTVNTAFSIVSGTVQIDSCTLVGSDSGYIGIGGGNDNLHKIYLKNTSIENFSFPIQQYAKIYNRDTYDIDSNSVIDTRMESGSVISSGSNSNGSYIKYADGTLVCSSHRAGPLSSPHNWVFPVPFKSGSTAIVNYSLNSYSGTYYTGNSYVYKNDNTSCSVYFSDTIPDAISLEMVAFGRWK